MGIINYSRDGELIEITIRDPSGAKIEKHVCNLKDKKKYASIIQYLKDKYGFEPLIDTDKSIKSVDEEIEDTKKEAIDWWGSGI